MTRVLTVLSLLIPAALVAASVPTTYYGHIDIPYTQSVARQDLVVHGWAFNCQRGGQQPFGARVMLVSSDPQEIIGVEVVRHSPLYRPDVRAAYVGTCAEVSSYTGFAFVVKDWTTLPTGSYTLVVEFADSYGVMYLQRSVTLY